jgi:hypothetical protein
MKKPLLILILSALFIVVTISKTPALINLDDESIKIAIKYGLDNRYSDTKTILGPNWIEGEDGFILTVYSPFIQLATKARSQNVPGASDEDIKLVKKRLGRQLNQITTRQEVRFIVQIVGSNPGVCKDYKAYVEEFKEPEETEEDAEGKKEGKGFWIFKKRDSKPKKLKADKEVIQNKADLDNYNPLMPYSCFNSYNFKFDAINKLDKFYFVLEGPKEKERRYLVEKNVIF